MKKIRVLFLSANPANTRKLNLEGEQAEIQEFVNGTPAYDYLEFVNRFQFKGKNLLGVLQKEQPDIVHFSCHGAKEDGLALEGGLVDENGITSALKAAGGSVKMVIFSACYSTSLAESATTCVDFCVGTKEKIPDKHAIAFAANFYQALGFGLNLAQAVVWGKAGIELVPKAPIEPDKGGDDDVNRDVVKARRQEAVATGEDYTPQLFPQDRDASKVKFVKVRKPLSRSLQALMAAGIFLLGAALCAGGLLASGSLRPNDAPSPRDPELAVQKVETIVSIFAEKYGTKGSRRDVQMDRWLNWINFSWETSQGLEKRANGKGKEFPNSRAQRLLVVETEPFQSNCKRFQAEIRLNGGLIFSSAAAFLKKEKDGPSYKPEYRQVEIPIPENLPLWARTSATIVVEPRKNERIFIIVLVRIEPNPDDVDLSEWSANRFKDKIDIKVIH